MTTVVAIARAAVTTIVTIATVTEAKIVARAAGSGIPVATPKPPAEAGTIAASRFCRETEGGPPVRAPYILSRETT